MNKLFKKRLQFKHVEDLPVRITDAVGSTTSLVIHTFLFAGIFLLRLFGLSTDQIMLILTTLVSLEAIYLSIFIQMTVNRNTQSLQEVEEDVDKIQEGVEEIEKDVDEIQKDVVEIQEDVEEIQEDFEEVEKDIDEIQKDVDEIQEDVEEIEKEDHVVTLEKIHTNLQQLMQDIENLKAQK